jgi:hypothetical protein
MSSSVVSNQNLTDFSNVNTTSSLITELLSNNPPLIEQAVFNAIVSIPNVITFINTFAEYEIRVADIVTAVSNSCILNILTSMQLDINFGMNAIHLISLLNLSERNPFVDLKFKTSTDNVAYFVNIYITTRGSSGITVSGSTILFLSADNLINKLRIIYISDTEVMIMCGVEKSF